MSIVIPARVAVGLILSLFVAVVLFLAGYAQKEEAAAGCEQWNTEEFFETATVDDVTACLAAGADPMAQGGYRETPLHKAAGLNIDPAVIKALLAAGADPMARKAYSEHTPLHVAAITRTSPAVIKALLAAGANVNARAQFGETPLQAALSPHSTSTQ